MGDVPSFNKTEPYRENLSCFSKTYDLLEALTDMQIF